ncbi:hypothetical protein [Konateibacter massiliensis]|uniref:hypothetical protein n=1 Tax=Konateibacter massiliensis TaxID=2002841 RepID=UPI000C157B8D|nr:hypothetical protein [Konateibacter massiliensis]
MKKRIFVAAPSCIASGGPELLHQLCFKLNKFGYNAKMLYYANKAENVETTEPVHPNYEVYNNLYTLSLEEANDEEAIVIMPEVAVELIFYLPQSKKIIWWLSVDNYYDNIQLMYQKDLRNEEFIDVFGLGDEELLHFVQSYYAKDFVMKRLNIEENKIYYLSDYLRMDFEEEKKASVRNNYCLFNPKKGLEKVLYLIGQASGITWLPIQNMTPKQVANLMDASKVYVDFGNHPGKDRIPREAALRGCCIITNKAGSAAYYEDVSIPEEYKFEDIAQSAPQIIELIKDIFQNFDEHTKQFEHYRDKIRKEEINFDKNVLEIFEELANN